MAQDRNMNRLANTQNSYQGSRKRVLCICSAGLLRSPTVAFVLTQEPYGFNTRAAGAEHYALVPLDEALVLWAHEIIVMNEDQAAKVKQIIKGLEDIAAPLNKTIHTLNLPDNYSFRQDALVAIIEEKMAELYPQEQLQEAS